MKIYDLVRHKYPMDTFQGNIKDNAGYQGLILNLWPTKNNEKLRDIKDRNHLLPAVMG